MTDGLDEDSRPHWSHPDDPSLGPDPAGSEGEGPSRYEPLGVLGAGGMGVVQAVHDRLLHRDVARKQARPGDRIGAAALRREAAMAAGLEHPGIVPVYDVGADAQGEPWYTMRLVRGRTLAQRVIEEEQPLVLLRSLLGAAEAVAYAHARGVVHCDLKSSNVMLGEHGEVQVADWGLASAGGEGRGGTPRSMSPEQVHGGPATPASDVWGLGLMLLELCGGPVGLSEQDRARLAVEPARDVFAAVLRDTPPELIAVLDRCLLQDPAARYDDAGALADELARFLDGRLVGAHAYTLPELARRWYGRHRGVVRVAAFGVVTLLVVMAAAWWRTAQESAAARWAEAAALDAEAESLGHLADALILAARGAARVGARPEAEVLAAHALALGESPQARGALMAFGDSPAPPRTSVPPLECEAVRTDPLSDRRLCLDDGRVALLGPGGWDTSFDADDAAFAGAFIVASDGASQAHVLGPDGERVGVTGPLVAPVSLVSGRSRAYLVRAEVLQAIDPETLGVQTVRPCGDEAIGAAQELSESQVALVCAYAGLGILDIETGSVRSLAVDLPDLGGSFRSLAASGQGALALANDRGQLVLVAPDERVVQRTVPCAVTDLLWTRDGSRLVASCRRGGAVVLDGGTGVFLGRLPARTGASFDGDGPTGVVGDGERWELGGLRPARFGGAVGLSAVLPQSGHLVLGGGDGSVVRVRTGDGAETARVAPDGRPVKDLVALPGGDLLALGVRVGSWRMASDLAQARLWNPRGGRRALVLGDDVMVSEYWPVWTRIGASGEQVARLPVGDRPLLDASAAADGTWAAGLTEDGRVVSLAAGADDVREVGRFPGASAVVALPGGRVGVAYQGTLVFLGEEVPRTVPLPSSRVLALAATPDGGLIAAAGLDGVVHLFDPSGRVLAVLEGHEERVVDLAFHDGLLVTASWDTTARLWDLRRLRAPPLRLVEDAEASWGLTMEAALAARTW